MASSEFIYTTYIKTTPEKVWRAITNPEVTRQYWHKENVSDWKKGSKWQHVALDEKRTVNLVGEVVESVPPRLLVLTWADPANPADASKVTFQIEAVDDMVRLDVLHGDFKPGSVMADRVAKGWPRVLSSLKSFLETGTPLNTWAGHNQDCAGATKQAAVG